MKKYTAVLFDLDGTITASKPGIVNSVSYALARFGISEKDPSKLEKFIGPPLMQSFQDFYGFDEEKARMALMYYREYFAARGIFENAVYEGIPEILAYLQGKGIRLGLATSKPTVFSEQILNHFDLEKYFSVVVGSNLDGTRVKKGEVITAAIQALGPEKGKVLMIGDRKHDILGARENGIDVLAVGYGYGSADELKKAGPDYYVQSVQSLKEFFKALDFC